MAEVPEQHWDHEDSLGNVVYHSTQIDSAETILRTGTFRLSSMIGTKSEEAIGLPKKKFFFLSTAREKDNDYRIGDSYNHNVTLVLNEDWFRQRYKVNPVDYWGSWKKKVGNPQLGAGDGPIPRFGETEDRIWSPEPFIRMTHVKAVVLEVHLLIRPETNGKIEDRYARATRELLVITKRLGIPIYWYTNNKDYIFMLKNKATPIRQLIAMLTIQKEHYWPHYSNDFIEPFRELFYKRRTKDLSEPAAKLAYRMAYDSGFGKQEMTQSFMADLHNNKKDPSLIKLVNIWKELDINTATQYIDFLSEKWTRIRKEENT